MNQKGTYAGVRFDNKTLDKIEYWLKENCIENAVPRDKLHSTLLYSRKYLPDYTPQGDLRNPMIGVPYAFDIWTSSSGKNCLVLKFICNALQLRHEYLMKIHNATFDYSEYTPHITLSYDIGIKKYFPVFNFPIIINHEYHEDLNLNWADSV